MIAFRTRLAVQNAEPHAFHRSTSRAGGAPCGLGCRLQAEATLLRGSHVVALPPIAESPDVARARPPGWNDVGSPGVRPWAGRGSFGISQPETASEPACQLPASSSHARQVVPSGQPMWATLDTWLSAFKLEARSLVQASTISFVRRPVHFSHHHHHHPYHHHFNTSLNLQPQTNPLPSPHASPLDTTPRIQQFTMGGEGAHFAASAYGFTWPAGRQAGRQEYGAWRKKKKKWNNWDSGILRHYGGWKP